MKSSASTVTRYACSVVFACLVAITTGRAQDAPSAAASQKLTTVLADLATSVTQDTGRLSTERVPNAPRVSVDTLPISVQDAVHSRRLRLNDRNEVQVYVLMSAV